MVSLLYVGILCHSYEMSDKIALTFIIGRRLGGSSETRHRAAWVCRFLENEKLEVSYERLDGLRFIYAARCKQACHPCRAALAAVKRKEERCARDMMPAALGD